MSIENDTVINKKEKSDFTLIKNKKQKGKYEKEKI